jgi:hypothetical protein
MTAMQEEAIRLYREGLDLRQVGAELGRSHEWVRLTLRDAGEPLRERGRVPKERPECMACGLPTATFGGRYCSHACRAKHQGGILKERLDKAMRLINQGATYDQAAAASDFTSVAVLRTSLYEHGYVATKHSKPLSLKI